MPNTSMRFDTGAHERIVVNPHLVSRLKAQPGLLQLAKEAALGIRHRIVPTASGTRATTTVSLKRLIGSDACLETPRIDLDTPTQFAMMPLHHEPIRVVLNREPTPSREVTLIVDVKQRGHFLVAAWIGAQSLRAPHDLSFRNPYTEAMPEIDFWLTHALAMNPNWGSSWTSTWRRTIDDALARDAA